MVGTAGFIGGSLIGGLFDRETANQTNKAKLASAAQDRDLTREMHDKTFKQDLGTVGTTQTSLNQYGGKNVINTPGSANDLLEKGDVGRAQAANSAGSDFKFTLPNLGVAQGVIDRDNALAQSSVDNAFNTATLRYNQGPGANGQKNLGSASSNFQPGLLKAQGDVADKLRLNREQNAIGLLQGSQQGDLKTLQQQILANQSLATDLKNPVTTQFAQMPFNKQPSDLSNAITPAVGSNFIAQLQQQQAGADAQANQLAIIRALGDQGAFSRKGTD